MFPPNVLSALMYLDIFHSLALSLSLADAFIAVVLLCDWEHRLHNTHYKMSVSLCLFFLLLCVVDMMLGEP